MLHKVVHWSKEYFSRYQDAFPIVPLGCSENQGSLQEFITKAKAALVAVGIIRDAAICKFVSELVSCCHNNECMLQKFSLSSIGMSTSCSMGTHPRAVVDRSW
jgi:hypothetical protein